MRIEVGRVAEISETGCQPVGEGRAIVARIGAEIRAYRNRCTQGSADLGDAGVNDGIVTCRGHRSSYRISDGAHIGSNRKLERLPIEIVNGKVFVMMPTTDSGDRPDRLLAADRDDTWPNGIQRPTDL